MATTIRILGWKAEGFRCPDHEINLLENENSPYKISLIQMPNGTGKTTTLNLLQAAMSGSGVNWSKDKINEFKKRGSKKNTAKFEVKLFLNDRLCTIIMDFDFEQGAIKYKTTSRTGQENGFKPPKEFKNFLSENCTKFYIFDGELAAKLLEKNDANAESVIRYLFQLNVFDAVKGAVDEHWKKQTEKVSSTEQRGLQRAKNDLKEKIDKLNKYKKLYAELKEEEIEFETELKTKQNLYKEIMDKSEKFYLESRMLKDELEGLERSKTGLLQELINSVADPTNLSVKISTELQTFKISLDRVRLPETAAREFFQELADESECVCGRPIDKHTKAEILKRSSQYLGSEDVSLLNSIKTSIDDSIGKSISDGNQHLLKNFTKLTSLVEAIKNVKLDIDLLNEDFQNESPENEMIMKDIEELNVQLANTRNDMGKYTDPYLFEEYNIAKLEKEARELEQLVATRTNTVMLNNKKKKLKEILTLAHDIALSNISETICIKTNEKIKSIMPNNHIRIKEIQKYIVLDGQAGGSIGEQLSVAYAFLSTMFQKAEEHSLPFIIDSPVGPIDLKIRPEIGSLVPKLGDQFLAFTISSERDGFLKTLKQNASSPIQYITLFRNSATDTKSLEGLNKQETDDGILIEDEDYFNKFQLETERQ